MTAKFGLYAQTQSGLTTQKQSFGRKSNILVVDEIIMDENHPIVKETQDFSLIGSVRGRIYDGGYNSNTITAKPAFGNKTHIPLVGECVYLYNLPSPNNETSTQFFYGDPISIYGNNSVNYNPLSNYPNINNDLDLNVKSLYPYVGDIIYEGRFGQSIRFGSTTSSNGWSNGTEKYDPITILSNGLPKVNTYEQEDFKNTKSSIWLTSTQQIPSLGLANETPISLYGIIKPSEYKSPQIILNSERIILNSKKDDIILSSEQNINCSSNKNINIVSEKDINLNGTNILMGTKPNKQPALLGNNTVNVLDNMINSLLPLITALSALPGINAPASMALSSLTTIQTTLETLKSKEIKLS